MKKHWSDYVLFYVGEAMILLAGEYYIISDHYDRHGAISLPFCVGMLLTGLVAGVAMHWALIKLAKQLIIGGYVVWLSMTGIILFSAGVIWTANSRREDHEKSLAEAAKLTQQKTQTEVEADNARLQARTAANLATMQALQPLLAQAKTQTEKKRILDTALKMSPNAQPTPIPLEEQVAAAMTAIKPAAEPSQSEEWRPFELGGFFDLWHSSVIRFTGLFGLLGMAVLFGLHLRFDDDNRALSIIQAGAMTTHTVQTPAPHHQSTANPIGYVQPTSAQQARPNQNSTFITHNDQSPNSQARQ